MANMELANFVFTVGSTPRFELSDLYEEIVLPTFMSSGETRKYAETIYSFYKVGGAKLSWHKVSSSCIYGRIVKDMVLKSEQRRGDGEALVPDDAKMETAPSSFFNLLLPSHKVIYVRQQSLSPKLNEFEHTFKRIMTHHYDRYIHYLYLSDRARRHGDGSEAAKRVKAMEADEGAGKWKNLNQLLALAKGSEQFVVPDGAISKAWLREVLPRPSLEIVPLPTPDSIREVIQQYKYIKHFEIYIPPKNSEPDNSPLLERLRERSKALGGTETTLTDRAKGDNASLRHDKVIEEIESASREGLNAVKIKGINQAGEKLSGDKTTFVSRHEIDESVRTADEEEAARLTFRRTVDLIRRGIVTIGLDKIDDPEGAG